MVLKNKADISGQLDRIKRPDVFLIQPDGSPIKLKGAGKTAK